MAVLVVARMTGNPDELAEKVLEHLTPVMNEVARQRGAVWHALAKTPDGVMVVDVWESADAVTAAVGEQRVQEAIERSALPQPQFDIYDLVEHRNP
ncbi:antibiotic biosynthesis monooxygenase [Georgenia yuyongxinii]|nr:antibiotic biosynthesis monooxygenase [Georgenia yuyongxinii]